MSFFPFLLTSIYTERLSSGFPVSKSTPSSVLFCCHLSSYWDGLDHDRKGFRYWNNPGAMNEYLVQGNAGHFVGLLACIQKSSIAFIFGPDLIVLSGSEMVSPRQNFFRAVRNFVYRLVFFYVFGVVAIGVICPSNDKRLTNGGAGAGPSPFVVGIKNVGIPVLDSIIAAILTNAWSAGKVYLYMSSRSLYSLAISGNAPSIFMAYLKPAIAGEYPTSP